MQEDKIIIEVEVNAGESAENLANVRSRIDALKDAQKTLKKEMKDLQSTQLAGGKITEQDARLLAQLNQQYATNQRELKELSAEEKMYTNQIALATQGDVDLTQSVTVLGQQLAALKAQYRSLDQQQRDSDAGKEMLANIQNLDNRVKELDYSLGDHNRNVGNYQSALLGLNGTTAKVANLFAGGFKQGLMAAGNALKSFGKALLTTPIGWISAAITALVAVFKQLKDAFRRNDDASTRLSAAMARLQPIITKVKDIFVGIANAAVKAVEWFSKVATTIMSKLSPAYREAAEAAASLVVAQDELEEEQRKEVVESAKRQKRISELYKEAADTQKTSARRRAEIYNEIDKLEEEQARKKADLLNKEVDQMKKAAKEEVNTSDETKNAIAQKEAEAILAEAEYTDRTVRTTKRRASAQKEAAAAVVEAKKTELEEVRKLEDMTIAMISDMTEKALKETQVRYEREIADLKTRLDTEKNLTAAAKAAINKQIVLLEASLQTDLQNIRDAASEEERQRIMEQAQANFEAQQQFAKEKREIIASQMTYAFNELQMKLNESLMAAGENARMQNEAQLQYAQDYLDKLKGMNAEEAASMFENFQQYQMAVQQAEKAVIDAQLASQEALQQQIEQVASTMQEVTGALSSLFEAAAEDSEAYEKFKKAIAIVDAMISMAQTIAAATTASTAGDPYTMAIRIAANVAAVTAQFAAVIKAIKAAAVPSSPSFSEGGIVPGESYTGDKVVSRLNSGEMILTRGMQENLLRLLSGVTPALGSDWSGMREAFRDAVAELPAPTLVYSEFQDFTRNVRKINNITKL